MVKAKNERDIGDDIMTGILIILSGLLLVVIGIAIESTATDISLNQETANDICRQITGDDTAIASNDLGSMSMDGGKLICTIPGFDSTQNIIVKSSDK